MYLKLGTQDDLFSCGPCKGRAFCLYPGLIREEELGKQCTQHKSMAGLFVALDAQEAGWSVPPSVAPTTTHTDLLSLIYLWPFLCRVFCRWKMETGKWQKPSEDQCTAYFTSLHSTSGTTEHLNVEKKNLLRVKPKHLSFVFFYCNQQISQLHGNKEDGEKQRPANK